MKVACSVILFLINLTLTRSQGLDDFIGIGRSIASFLGSGVNDFIAIKSNLKKEKEFQDSVSEDIFSTDELFGGLSDVWDKKRKDKKDKARQSNQGVKQNSKKEESSIISTKQNNLHSTTKSSDTNTREKDESKTTVEQDNEKEDILILSTKQDNIPKVKGNSTKSVLKPESENKIILSANTEDVSTKTNSVPSDNTTQQKEDSKSNHWMRIKVIANNMKSIFQQTYGEDSEDKIEVLRMLDKLMDIGDKINMVQNIGNSFDQDLLEFLMGKWVDIEQKVLDSNPILKTMLSVDGKVLFLAIAKGLVKQFGSVFHKQALAHLNEQDFVIETMRTSGFTDPEIYDVFELLDLPTDALVQTSKTLKEGEKESGFEKDDVLGRSGGYGGGHHGGGGYGYSMMKKDPLILLAGVAFATFAAYIIYRLLSSTPAVGGRKKRDFPDVSLSLTLSDMPEVMGNIYSWLEKTEQLYGVPDEEDNSSTEDGIINSLNEIWESYETDPISRSCVKRNLCYQLQKCSSKSFCYGTNIKQLLLLSLAEMMGESGAGKLADSQYTKLLKGQRINCEVEFPSCNKSKISPKTDYS